MKKLLTLACAALASTFLFAASPATGVDVSLPGTTPFTLDDFEEGMYLNAIVDTWNSFGNVFKKTQFSDSQSIKPRWDGKGNCGAFTNVQI